ncbi:hypothetical protein LOTGIDRAFT_208088 [Lottia gigantea]|uniref:Transmembrane protein 8B n=1 Tax=Lottia gigantea TaxID=225164 RepID=V4BC06_LOTGI|nr:hypothetical protein LOTGIDRAFT_208088 [Lottia gigantea]ESP05151.1 hypothetical protein LOTGIDRAFT_208088 [Lottia gigantea]
MFFSTFYHACDGDREDVYTLCIMKYNVLSFCDFLGSVCSLWVTVVAMARVYSPVTVLLQVSAPLFLVVGVLYDRTSLYVIAVPLLLALVLMAISWGVRCKKRKTCYPTWRRYLFCLLPGILIAATGAFIFAFAETESNYRFIHSVWHMTLSLSIIFLLPSRNNKKVTSFI